MNDHKFCFRDANKTYHKIYCNKDWCIILYKDGDIVSYISSNDDRAFEELEEKRKVLENESNVLKRRKN